MKKGLLLGALLVSGLASAQYDTPGTGVTWSLQDLADNAPDSVIIFSNGEYTILQGITISLTDKLLIETPETVKIKEAVEVKVEGSFTIDSPDRVTITAIDTTAKYKGFRFEEGSSIFLKNATITNGGGLRVLTETFEMDNCTISYHNQGSASGSVITFSRGTPVVKNSIISYNDYPAFSSGANQSVAAQIINNQIEYNTLGNTNRPQINMGPSGTTDSTRIIGNTIIGDRAMTKVGAISVANMLGTGTNLFVIEGNTIKDNRYGISVTGVNSFGVIRKNIIEDNDTENNPAMGGSGITFTAASEPSYVYITENEIRRNLWGVTVLNKAHVNLGSDDPNTPNIGKNVFSENGNNGSVTALYNNTAIDFDAMFNCWIEGEEELTETMVEDVITHKTDDAALGEVNYSEFGCETGNTASIKGAEKGLEVSVFPNPNAGEFTITVENNAELTLVNGFGQEVATETLTKGANTISLDVPAGLYFANVKAGNQVTIQKVVVK